MTLHSVPQPALCSGALVLCIHRDNDLLASIIAMLESFGYRALPPSLGTSDILPTIMRLGNPHAFPRTRFRLDAYVTKGAELSFLLLAIGNLLKFSKNGCLPTEPNTSEHVG